MTHAELIDLALGHIHGALGQAAEPGSELTLTHASADFFGPVLAASRPEVVVDIQKSGRTMAFAGAFVWADGQRVARVSAVYKVG